MKISAFIFSLLSFLPLFLIQQSAAQQPKAPALAAAEWNDMRVGLFVHWGLYSGAEGAWNGTTIGGGAEWIQQGANIHSNSYATTLRPLFTPSTTWAADLALSAKNAGMEYVVITAKHHDGFTLFNSAEHWSTGATVAGKTTNPYGGSNISPAGRDLMLELVTAVRAQGLKVGFYYSLIDWQHPNAYRGNNGLPKPNVMSNGRIDENTAEPDAAAGSYKTYIFNHIQELLTNYGKIDEVWFDYSSTTVQDTDWDAAAMVTMMRNLQPNVMINNRLHEGLENSNDDFATPERTIPATGLPFHWETVTSWDNTSWGYKSDSNGASYKTPLQAIKLYAEASSKGGNMLLNVGPDRFGAIPSTQATRMTALGTWMATNGEALKNTRASGIDASSQWGRMTMHKEGNRYYAIVFDRPADGVIDITSVTAGKIVNSISVTRLTASGSVSTPVTKTGGTYTVNLNSGDLDSLQSSTFRIELDATKPVTLSNLALNKTTTSSSVFEPTGLNLHSGLAVNGNKSANTDSGNYSFFHSASNDTNPWFQVDLGGTYRLRQITLYNRAGFTSRLRDITIQILDASDNVVSTISDLNDGNTLNGPSTLNVILNDAQVVSGRKVRVSRASDSGGGDENTILALSEIEVTGSVLADANLDGVVDQKDLDILAANWGSGTSWDKGDVNGDGQVDQADLTTVLAGWTDAEKANLANVPAPFFDSDNDKLDDNWEVVHFGNTTSQDHTSNNDGDAYDNLWELAFGGDPTVAEKQLGVVEIASSTSSTAIIKYPRPKNYNSTGIIYQIKSSSNLVAWADTTASIGTPASSVIDERREKAHFNVPITGSKRFFRVQIASQTP